MSERRMVTKADLLADIERAWIALDTALNHLSEAQMITIKDDQGWTVKDHIIHMTSWERSVVFLLQGKPRHEGLEVDQTLYLQSDYDEINGVIQSRHKNLPLADALTQFHQTHQQLLQLLQPLTDHDLQKPHHHYLSEKPGDDSGRPVIDVIYGNSAHHFGEHLAWIEALVN